MKKIFAGLTFLIVMGMLFANGAAETSKGAEKSEMKFKIATSLAPNDSIPKALDEAIKEISERTDGRMEGVAFHSSQLGSQRDYLDGLQMGSMQIAETSTSLLAGIDPKFAIFDMPYISKNVEHCQSVLDNGLAEILSKSLEEKAGLKILGWAIRTPRNVYSSKGPINSVADFKGLKIRTMETKAVMGAMTLLGASPVPIPGTERYMALQTKVVDAAENSSAEILVKKEYEVTKYISKTEHLIAPNPIICSVDWFNKLDKETQGILMDVFGKTGLKATKLETESLVDVEKELAKKGMIINNIDNKKPFVDAMAPLYEEYKNVIGADIFNLFLK